MFSIIPLPNKTFIHILSQSLPLVSGSLIRYPYWNRKPGRDKIVLLSSATALPWLQADLPHTVGRFTLFAYLLTPLCPEQVNPLSRPSYHLNSLPVMLQLKQNSWRCLGSFHDPFWSIAVCLLAWELAHHHCLLPGIASAIAPSLPGLRRLWQHQIHLLHLTFPSPFQTSESLSAQKTIACSYVLFPALLQVSDGSSSHLSLAFLTVSWYGVLKSIFKDPNKIWQLVHIL